MQNEFKYKLTIYFKINYKIENVNYYELENEIDKYCNIIFKEYKFSKDENIIDFDPKNISMYFEYYIEELDKKQEDKLKILLDKYDYVDHYTIILSKSVELEEEKIEIEKLHLDSLFDRIEDIIRLKKLIKSIEKATFSETVEKYNKVLLDIIDYQSKIEKNILALRTADLKKESNFISETILGYTKALNKEIKLHISGLDINIDRQIFSKIKKHIINILFNSLIYGIENKKERLLYDKSENGNLYLNFREEFGYIIIEIMDDGRGIDSDYIYSRAIKSRLLKIGRDYTEEEILTTIFFPEMSSTNDIEENKERDLSITLLYNIVKKLNGNIILETKQNEYTKYTIKLPLEFMFIKGRVVKIGEKKYVVPENMSNKIVDIDFNKLTFHFKTIYHSYKSKEYPVLLLPNYVTDVTTKEYMEYTKGLLVKVSNVEYILLVKDVFDVEDLVVRKSSNNELSEMFLGETLLSNNKRTSVLNVGKIVDMISIGDVNGQ